MSVGPEARFIINDSKITIYFILLCDSSPASGGIRNDNN